MALEQSPALAEQWATAPGGRLSLWTITKTNGSAVRLCDASYAVTIDGNEFSPIGSPVASADERVLGFAPGTAELSAAFEIDGITDADIRKGLYRGAEVRQEITSLAAPWVGRLTVSILRVRDVRWNGLVWEFACEDLMALLSRPTGRTAKVVCDHNLGSSTATGGCRVDLAGFTAAGTVTAVGVQRASAVFSGLEGGDYYRHGTIEWLTGANAGMLLDVRLCEDGLPSGTLIGWAGLTARDVAVGDTARCIAGCDGRFSTCVSKFNNGRNFGGFPFIPGVSALIDYPPYRRS